MNLRLAFLVLVLRFIVLDVVVPDLPTVAHELVVVFAVVLLLVMDGAGLEVLGMLLASAADELFRLGRPG
jgi:hypothetical protein